MKSTLHSTKTESPVRAPAMNATVKTDKRSLSAPLLGQRAPEIQQYGQRFPLPVGLPDKVCEASIATLNQILADTMVLVHMYRKHHWQVSGPTFYQLHLLLDKHYEEQAALVDVIAERIQALGGISIAMPHDIAEMSRIERPPRGREEVPVQLSRLLEGHEVILKEIRAGVKQAAENGDEGTADMLVSQLIRTHELQVWFVAEHLVNTPVVDASERTEILS